MGRGFHRLKAFNFETEVGKSTLLLAKCFGLVHVGAPQDSAGYRDTLAKD